MTGEVGPRAPRAAADLVGHTAAEAELLAAYKSDRLHHAWLISGPKGVGKATLAYRFARFLLAEGEAAQAGPSLFGSGAPENLADASDTLHMAPEHPVFRRVSAAGHADLMAIERTVNEKTGKLRTDIPVDAVRGVERFMRMTAGEGAWRAAIIDSADELNRNAANALLKVLEEPPERAVLLLVSHNPAGLLPTLRSRCRSLVLRPLAEADLTTLLAGAAPEVPEEDRRLAAELGAGSPGKALSLIEDGGLDLYRDLLALLAHTPARPVSKITAFAEKLGGAGREREFELALTLFRGWLERFIAWLGAGRVEGGLAPEERGVAEKMLAARAAGPSGRGGLEPWLEVWEKTSHLMVRASSLNLERKHVILSLFTAVGRAARGGA